MHNIDHQLLQAVMPPIQTSGTVTQSLADGSLTVESEGLHWHCKRAVSCVIAPEIGDTVLITAVNHQMWLLAVLERVSQQAAELSVQGDLHIFSSGELRLSSEVIGITSEQGDCHIKQMTYSGEQLSAWVGLSRIVGKNMESFWQSVTQVSQHLLRSTRHTEQVRAGQLDMKAEDYVRLHAHNAVITSTAITKVDSEQIHMG